MTALYAILGIVVLAALAIGWGRRSARNRGRLAERAKTQAKAIRDAQEADRIRRAVGRGDGRDKLRRFDRD